MSLQAGLLLPEMSASTEFEIESSQEEDQVCLQPFEDCVLQHINHDRRLVPVNPWAFCQWPRRFYPRCYRAMVIILVMTSWIILMTGVASAWWAFPCNFLLVAMEMTRFDRSICWLLLQQFDTWNLILQVVVLITCDTIIGVQQAGGSDVWAKMLIGLVVWPAFFLVDAAPSYPNWIKGLFIATLLLYNLYILAGLLGLVNQAGLPDIDFFQAYNFEICLWNNCVHLRTAAISAASGLSLFLAKSLLNLLMQRSWLLILSQPLLLTQKKARSNI